MTSNARTFFLTVCCAASAVVSLAEAPAPAAATASPAAPLPSPDPATRLEVHEWGTFTVLSGSDGPPLKWYQPQSALAELPDFVQPSLLGAKSGPVLMRMETPVVYFYPEKPMEVTLIADFRGGRITEWHPVPLLSEPDSLNGVRHKVTWRGKLLPPDQAVTLAAHSQLGAPPHDSHYFRAREVPEAWYFASTKPEPPATAETLPLYGRPRPPQVEKFIFYRGAGDVRPPFQAEIDREGKFTLSNQHADKHKVRTAFALKVDSQETRWQRMQAAEHQPDRLNASPETAGIPALTEAMAASLQEAGLSHAEAKAMVATWDQSWFAEPGTRVLALLPGSWVNEVLPLTITPRPKKLVRVFVARFELFTPQQEDELVALLNPAESGQVTASRPGPDAAADASAVGRFKALQLNRFADGARALAETLVTNKMWSRFSRLRAAADAGGR